MVLKTEDDVLELLTKTADMVSMNVLSGESARGIAALADIALCAIRQKEPFRYGCFNWQQHPLYGPYGSTVGEQR